MAHLFEHLMFGQTQTLPPGEFDRLVERTGGESNAATWVDWTYYRPSLPARDLELAVRPKRSDDPARPRRGGRSGATSSQRAARVVEDDVDVADEQLMSLAFKVIPIAGRRSAGCRISGRAARRHPRLLPTWYAPNNATLVVVGDFDEGARRPGRGRLRRYPAGGAAWRRLAAERSRPRAPLTAGKPIAPDRVLLGWRRPARPSRPGGVDLCDLSPAAVDRSRAW
jgi:zinc protease